MVNSQSLLEKNQKNLEAMKLVNDASLSLDTTTWLWGGLVGDVFWGKFTRVHDDLDYLVKDLHQLKEQFSENFFELGWETENLENGDLRCKKDGREIHLGHVELSRSARWTHNGEKGSIVFPVIWLPAEAIDFYEISVHVVSPKLQYVLKTHPQLLNPKWQAREKDILDLGVLEKILTKRGVELTSLRAMVIDV